MRARKKHVNIISPIVHVFTNTELKNFFSRADSLDQNKGLPYSNIVAPIIFRLMYSCGLRPNEARQIELNNINLTTGVIFIKHNKQHSERLIPMSDDMLIVIKKYIKQRELLNIESKWLFFQRYGNQYDSSQLNRLFKRCWVSIDKNKSTPNARPYDLRHQFASTILQKWLDEGRDLYAMLPYLREYLGHKHFSSTAYYIHMLPEVLLKSSSIDWQKFQNLIPEVN